MNKFKDGIGLRLLRYVFGCYLIVTLIVTSVQLITEYRQAKSNIFSQIHELEASFKDSIMSSMWSFDTPQLEVTLAGITKIDIVAGIKIINEKNQTLAFSGDVVTTQSQVLSRSKIQAPEMQKIELLQTDSLQRQTLFEYKFPLKHRESINDPLKLIGYGYIYTDVNTIIDRVKDSFILIIINSLIKTAALWLFFLYFINRFIAKPLEALANAAEALNPEKLETLSRSKELDNVVKTKHNDELYLLASNFDQMRIAILDKMAVIETQKSQLEERVLDRTQSLSKANDELRHLALHDALTSLPNRTLFKDRLAQFIEVGKRNHTRFIVASIDLSGFKSINDSYGHQIGDLILVEVARRLASVFRSTDTVARMGGDEFYALLALERDDGNDAERLAQKFIKVLETPILCDAENIPSILISANIGTAIYPVHGEDSATLIKNADMAMYHAKNSGIHHFHYSAEEDLRLKRQTQLAQDFNTAIENDELFVVYQPILNLASKRITKIEVLVRWQHPNLGVISPVEFIPICERTGSIHQLTQWVFQQACIQCKPYCDVDESLSISINLSGRVFSQPQIPHILEDICKRTNISPFNINLEVTETTAMEKPDQAIDIMKQLTGKGFTISIDDFGTGYSSLSYLVMLPVKELKIDKSFLLSLGENSEKVIKAMIDLAHSLNLKVVGEGVETKELLDMLGVMGCDYAQGYYIAMPLSGDELQDFLYPQKVLELHSL